MKTTIPCDLAEALASAHERTGSGSEVDGHTTVGTQHIRHDDYQSYELLAFHTPEGDLYGFETVRNFGAGEGGSPGPVGADTKDHIEVMPLESYTKSVKVFSFDYDRK